MNLAFPEPLRVASSARVHPISLCRVRNAPAIHSRVIILFDSLGGPRTEYTSFSLCSLAFVPPYEHACVISPFTWGRKVCPALFRLCIVYCHTTAREGVSGMLQSYYSSSKHF